jgi:hypothetical protein
MNTRRGKTSEQGNMTAVKTGMAPFTLLAGGAILLAAAGGGMVAMLTVAITAMWSVTRVIAWKKRFAPAEAIRTRSRYR